MASVFERMMVDFSKKDTAKQLEECMSFRPEKVSRVPLRYRLIAMGFVGHLSLEELNQKLKDTGCEQLYARNLVEASLIYAFLNHLSYEEWKGLERECAAMASEWQQAQNDFPNSGITYRELRDYVECNSTPEGEELYTRQVTRFLQRQIQETEGSREKFRKFVLENRASFSRVREKTRYYFCKFLCYYLERQIDQYLEASRAGFGVEEALANLSVLKSAAKLRRKKGTEEELREMFLESGISCGNLYDAFNFFYFDYVSSDWMEVLLDYYGGDIRSLPARQKKELAQAIRAYQAEWKDLGDEEVLQKKWQEMEEKERQLDEIYALDGQNRGYQKNRSGEKSVRNYIRGTLDIDRTTLLCWLLFFEKEGSGERERELTRERLDEILLECGFGMLQEKDDFDYFVIRYLQEQDPVSYLMEEVTEYALEEKNSFLYHMYQESVSNDETIRKIMGLGKD